MSMQPGGYENLRLRGGHDLWSAPVGEVLGDGVLTYTATPPPPETFYGVVSSGGSLALYISGGQVPSLVLLAGELTATDTPFGEISLVAGELQAS